MVLQEPLGSAVRVFYTLKSVTERQWTTNDRKYTMDVVRELKWRGAFLDVDIEDVVILFTVIELLSS